MEELYRFYFQFYCSLDATTDDGSLRRSVNDARYFPNSRIKQVNIDDKPKLCLFVLKDISWNEEIRYFYGDDSVPLHAGVSLIV